MIKSKKNFKDYRQKGQICKNKTSNQYLDTLEIRYIYTYIYIGRHMR